MPVAPMVVGEVEDRLDEQDRTRHRGQIGGKGRVELDVVEGEAAQVRKRGECGTEVVEGELKAERF